MVTVEQIQKIVAEEVSKVQHKLIERVTMETKEAAVYLGISEEQLRIMSRANEIPHFKMRSQYYYRKDTLDAWMSEQEGFTPKAPVTQLPVKKESSNKEKALAELMEGFKKLLEV